MDQVSLEEEESMVSDDDESKYENSTAEQIVYLIYFLSIYKDDKGQVDEEIIGYIKQKYK